MASLSEHPVAKAPGRVWTALAPAGGGPGSVRQRGSATDSGCSLRTVQAPRPLLLAPGCLTLGGGLASLCPAPSDQHPELEGCEDSMRGPARGGWPQAWGTQEALTALLTDPSSRPNRETAYRGYRQPKPPAPASRHQPGVGVGSQGRGLALSHHRRLPQR